MLGIREVFLSKVVDVAIGLSPGCDAEVQGNGSRIKQEVDREEERQAAVLFCLPSPACCGAMMRSFQNAEPAVDKLSSCGDILSSDE